MSDNSEVPFDIEEYKKVHSNDSSCVIKTNNNYGHLDNLGRYDCFFLIAPCKKWNDKERHIAVLIYRYVRRANTYNGRGYKFIGVQYLSLSYKKDVSYIYDSVWQANPDDVNALYKIINDEFADEKTESEISEVKHRISKHIEQTWSTMCDDCNALVGNNRHQVMISTQ